MRNNTRFNFTRLAFACITAAFAYGCSAAGSSNAIPPGGGGGTDGGMLGPDGAMIVPDGGTVGTDGAVIVLDGSVCEHRCSSDLHSVVDCKGEVVRQCPADQACGANLECVSPCQAASDNKSTVGCEFFSVPPATEADKAGHCFAVLVANTWGTPVSVQVEYAGASVAGAFAYVPVSTGGDVSYTPLEGDLPPGELAVFFLAHDPEAPGSFGYGTVACPGNTAVSSPVHAAVTSYGSSFRIVTSAPTVAYDVYPWGGASAMVTSASLLIPTTAWGTNFVTADAWQTGNPFTQVVAASDNTTITIVPSADVRAGVNVPALSVNQPANLVLQRGQVLSLVQSQRLAGSVISTDKPVGVWGGAGCMNIPTGEFACDAAHQQLPSVPLLGSEYVVARYPSRGGDDLSPVTLVGAVDGTTLAYDPMPAGDAPTSLHRGQVAVFYTAAPFVVKSQDDAHPFYVAVHMTSGDKAGKLGDPEFTNVVPPKQFLTNYLFATDPTYKFTSVVLVRERGGNGAFEEVEVDCLGTITGWQPVDSAGRYEVARPLIWQNGQSVGGCTNGVRRASSKNPFGVWVWGYSQYASYGYPGGMSVRPINQVVVQPTPR